MKYWQNIIENKKWEMTKIKNNYREFMGKWEIIMQS